MKKNLIIMSLFMVIMVLFMAGSVCAQPVEANKTAQVTGVDTATVNIEVNGSSDSTRLPADVVFAIDASGSMSTSDPTGLRKTGAISFINQMNNTTDKVGVVNWANIIKQQQGLTSNFTQAINVVNQNTPGGTTNGALAMQTSINILSLSSLPANQRNIILLTDGEFNAGGNATLNPDQMAIFYATQAKNLGYNVYTIGLGPDVNPTVLTQMASVINGVPQYYFANNASVIESIYNQIFQSITTQAKNITVTDVVPNYMTYVGATIVPTTNVLNPDGTRTLTWFIPSLGQGQNWNVSYNLMSMKNGFNIPTNLIANITYTDPHNNTGNLTLPIPLVDFPANLNVTKHGTPEPIWSGSLLSYHMTIQNDGPHTAWNVSFLDTIPPVLTSGVQYSLDNANWNPYTSEQNVPLGNLSVGQTVTFWIRGIVDINAPAPGTITNTVNAYLNGTFNNNATANNNLIPAADLAIIKTANQTSGLISGQNVTFTLTVTNLGPNNATNVMAYDPIPTGIASFGAATPSQGTWDPITGIWNIGTLTVGQIVTLVFNVTINNTFIGNITNIATVNGTEFDPNPQNNQDLEVLFVETPYVPTADLTISKTVDEPTPNYGDTIHFTVIVFNAGPDAAQDVLVTDVWPSGLIFVSSTPVPSLIVGNIYTWNLGTLGHEQSATINITAIVNATGLITNFVNVTSTTFDPHPEDNNATANVTVEPSAHVVLNKTVNNLIPDYWSLVTFTITALNTGPNDAQGVQVTDILPAGLTYVSSIFTPGTTYDSNTGIWNIGTLLNGTSAFLNIIANVTGVGTITNWASVTNQTTFDPLPWSEDNETINVPSASIFTLHKEWRANQDGTPINTAQYQDNVWVVFSATNLGPSFATITLSDALPAGFVPDSYWQYKWDSGSWINVPSQWIGSWLASIDVGQTLWVAIPGQITVANTTLNNIVYQTSQTNYNPQYPQGPPYGNASAQVDIPLHSHVVITKTVNNSTPNYGSTIIFTVIAHNNGPNDASGVQVVDNLPTGLVFVSYLSSQGIYNSTTGIWNVGTLLNGTNATLNLTAIVNATGEMINWASEANATINVPKAAALYLVVNTTTQCIRIPNNVLIQFKLGNNGPDTAENVVVTWVVPKGMKFVSATPESGYGTATYDAATRTLTWNVGDVPISDPYLNILLTLIEPGKYLIDPSVASDTFNPTSTNITPADVCAISTNGTNGTNGSSGNNVPMQDTGAPLALLAIAILSIVAGIIMPKGKN
ncbi:MAG: VWA domain-containing protein [Methanobacteriaceae archaeon]|nr:VWA domain-containing protein [Methanobacteriaceae archaeon]MDO9627125.1 VWA domain-containing protein [Methanobacteriaceae archaeon]